MKKHYETHVEDTDKLISVAGPVLDYKSWYEQYRKLMEEQAQRKYGLYTPTSEGDEDDFPSIPGMIARYSALGLTNEQMEQNPVWVDKTGNGHDLQMKNLAWGGMSGVGGYNQNFNQWGYGNLSTATQTHTSYKIELSVPSTLKTANIYSNANSIGKEGDVYDFTLNIVGLKDGALLRITKGVVSGVIDWFNDGAFVLEYNSNNATNKFVNRPISFGNVNIEMDLPNNFTYQTSKSYKGVPITTGSFKGTNSLFVGKLNNIIGNYSNVAIWELVFLDHDATEEELTKIKDYFVKTYPWLFPDQAWTVTGKTNEDEDRATIANITGNGNDLVLSNFGFAEGSGYNEEGEYAGYLVTDGVDDRAVASKPFMFEADFTFIGEWRFLRSDDTVAGIVCPSHLYIQNRYNKGATVMINSTWENFKNKTDYMTFKAITSKGKGYDENWNEVDLLHGEGSRGWTTLEIGGQENKHFSHMIFKNMALYMGRTLSKADCIKAYNYLQTLKAK